MSLTEEAWLGATSPQPLVQYLLEQRRDSRQRGLLRRDPRVRKLRLFACACCRCIFPLLGDVRSRAAVEAAERYADRGATKRALEEAYEAGVAVVNAERDPLRMTAANAARWAAVAGSSQTLVENLARYAASEAAAAERLAREASRVDAALWGEVGAWQCLVLLDVFGNPFRPAPAVPSFGAWNEGTILNMARAIYEERAFDRMPILGDALEEAGCTDEALLDHCRGEGPHVRGCWLLDLLLGKE
jgi:hypothetical protein